ncbi:MAG: ABC transporter ATP-binding protein [Fervidobacterium sp.]|uniref:Energy-coupling factor transport system ATP-binding protein n=1 Tax=Fervidobacterium gondwanense DSM 13020 TaxID=1121883 RepID=A0A1M7SSD7_FERGO|nr:ABC transporter ATP-binding protein [Fervidobacterium gondwanense]SHN61338.1 energy-coupling factor transport system ATP-binding protein [Fervidobacterium gondwanense DSM 13020]
MNITSSLESKFEKSLITVQNLYFTYKDEEYVLKNISVEIDSRPTAIVGQNGAGKTTFVKLLKGLLTPSKGDIFVCGMNTKDKTVAELSKVIGLVFQNPSDQIFKSKVIDEVMFGPLNILKDKQEAYKKSIKALEIVGLNGREHDHPYDLTLSERKLLCLASVLAMEPDILILDEPTIAQDRYSVKRLGEIIQELIKNGKSVITITHDMDFVLENFERTIVFNEGIIVSDGETEKVLGDDEIIQKSHLETPWIIRLSRVLDRTPRSIFEILERGQENI